MTSLAKSLQNYMLSMPFYTKYQNVHDQNQPLYQQSHPLPQHQQATAYDPNAPIYEAKQKQYSPGISKARKTFAKCRRYLKIVVFISNIISAVLSGYMLLTMTYMTVVYLQTRNKTAYNKNHVLLKSWSSDTKTWPTYMLLASAALTLLDAVVSLLRYCLSSRTRVVFKLIFYLIHIALWIVVAVMFRLGKTGDDLWGWSCNMEGGEREQLFKDVLNYKTMCTIQGTSWQGSIAESALKVLWTLVGWIYSRRISKIQGKIVGEMGSLDDLDM